MRGTAPRRLAASVYEAVEASGGVARRVAIDVPRLRRENPSHMGVRVIEAERLTRIDAFAVVAPLMFKLPRELAAANADLKALHFAIAKQDRVPISLWRLGSVPRCRLGCAREIRQQRQLAGLHSGCRIARILRLLAA
jgi:hypothetical protein